MKIKTLLRIGTVWLAILGIALPNTVLGATPQQTTIHDVKLGANGELRGQIVDAAGQPAASQTVRIHRDGQLIANTSTDTKGQFVAQNLANGVYNVAAGDVQRTYRVWDDQSAPPIAQDQAVQVGGEEIIRGQQVGGGGLVAALMSRPGLLAMAVAVAIAVPIAVGDNDDAS